MENWHRRLAKAIELRGTTGAALAKATGNKPASVSDWLSGKTKMMGGENAVKTCGFLRISQEWLFFGKGRSGLEDDLTVEAIEVKGPFSSGANHNSYEIREYKEVSGAMGKGIILKDQPGQITSLHITEEWLNKNVPTNTGKDNLCVVTGFGDSMKGMYNSGDPLLVDTGIKSCEHDGVYFFRVGNEGFIKRLQRIPSEGIRVISENSRYESWTIKPEMDFEVFAKVLKVWESTDF
jgi:phage repressor protein C with HTH and peptisase S24 domain